MVEDLRHLIAAHPFAPFSMHIADGGQLRVPTVDHIAVSPTGARVIVFADDDSVIHVSPMLVSRLTVNPSPGTAPNL